MPIVGSAVELLNQSTIGFNTRYIGVKLNDAVQDQGTSGTTTGETK